ncbi:hypothetical protein M513_06868 [Trichuris suis]|uniref:Uncharacterized protein n=1 Tax=Trichuris suis TaxID=68888 RepID=A0A085M509_9BILA|nr:hypothetical protein M513_06868 [Trichuris suis]
MINCADKIFWDPNSYKDDSFVMDSTGITPYLNDLCAFFVLHYRTHRGRKRITSMSYRSDKSALIVMVIQRSADQLNDVQNTTKH